jgi:hypothetical protein
MRNSDRKRDWGFILIGLLALTFIGLVIAYKYTGDFSGLATLRTNRQVTSLISEAGVLSSRTICRGMEGGDWSGHRATEEALRTAKGWRLNRRLVISGTLAARS